MNHDRTAGEFCHRLRNINAGEVAGEGYARSYLDHLIKNCEYYTAIYKSVLNEVEAATGKEAKEITIVDYGCGNGLLGLFAWYCGFGQVIFQDVDDDFLDSAERLCKSCKADRVSFVKGEIGGLVGKPLRIDAVAGTDVIEHIYNLDDFLSKVKFLNPSMVTVFTTAANPSNPFLVKKIRELQYKDEYLGNEGGNLSGKPHPPFIETRRAIIAEKFPDVKEVDELAAATRGLAGADIVKAVDEFILTKRLPAPAQDANTCDPLTGSFTERILSISQYNELYARHGFKLEIKRGFYNGRKKGLKGLPGKVLNKLLFFLGKTFSPFIIIKGFQK
ncbi:MAG: methyltransferase domain-containing protein [Chitinophagaceae bacterium]|nr:MAG: methyltransferase domain-containing protein [Chitinophagaceae bacterium]